MREEENKAIKELRMDLKDDDSMIGTDVAIVYKDDLETALSLIEKLQKEVEYWKGNWRKSISESDKIYKKLEEVKKAITYDRMEQLDDYVIYLQTKYLEILGENDDVKNKR